MIDGFENSSLLKISQKNNLTGIEQPRPLPFFTRIAWLVSSPIKQFFNKLLSLIEILSSLLCHYANL